MKKQLNSVLIKPAGPDCNMACKYCFYLKKSELFSQSKVHRMSEEILEEMVHQLMNQPLKQISFGWQGGEPTLMGLPFFKKAVEFQQKYGKNQSVGNGLQTNGILIDDKWARFLAQYKFLTGVSLDGPQHIHDHYRLSAGGKGTWTKVVDSAKRMLDTAAEVNALVVVTDYSAQFAEEIYQFHRELGLNYMQFIPCVETDPNNADISAPFSVPAEKYGELLIKLFDLWMNDFYEGVPTTSIRYFDSVFYTYVDLPAPECTLLPECGVYVVVEHNGDVYSCDFFVEPKWKLGNVLKDNLVDLLNSPLQSEFGKNKANLPDECKNCQWLKHCWGGCTKDRIKDKRDKNHNNFCDAYKMFFEHADDRFKKLAEEWKTNQEHRIAETRKQVLQAIGKGEIQVTRNDPCPCGSGKKFKKCCGMEK